MFSLILRTIQLAIKSLFLNLLRSGLTMLGIVFGVFSVIAMLAIGEGASAQAQKQVLELGATNIIITSLKPPSGSKQLQTGSGRRSRVVMYGLLRSDFRLLKKIPHVTRAIPVRDEKYQVRHDDKEITSRLVGCTVEYPDVTRLEISRGRFIEKEDNEKTRNVAVLASNTADQLFPSEDPIGKDIRVKLHLYRIIGVTKERGSSAAVGGSLSAQNYDLDVYIPIQTFRAINSDLIIKAETGSFSAEQVELNQITLQVDHRDHVISVSQSVREALELTHPNKNDYTVVVPMELLKQADQIKKIFNIVLGSIACISLVVGGIGIMNIMLATVTERTREIGIRRALGARQKDIVIQFLTETAVIAGCGGLLGILLGIFTPEAFALMQWVLEKFILEKGGSGGNFTEMFKGMKPQVAPWSIPVSFFISVGIGLFSGLYPAIAAARLHPIEALRHE
ncbi:ABC-type antimicrobial peptide transport system, permease component [hydrothermal vent metagenome]|uniref:ABC-type antimicrobial peptide transport system, permease component n=1 Tax=hydrothermal vent metagenome TaxID=652676 RepID=A0A3B1DWM7_9ZZZZ